jgi:hypothetical protein
VIRPADGPPTIEAGPDGPLTLTLPVEHARDPAAGLTAEQRVLLGPDARLTILRWDDDWLGEAT